MVVQSIPAATAPAGAVTPARENAILEISLPRDGMETRSSHHFFAVDALLDDGQTYRVLRQFSDFEDLHRVTGQVSFHGAAFPPKKGLFSFGKVQGLELEERRRSLEAWLQRLAADVRSQPGQQWFRPLHRFLSDGRLVVPSAPTAQQPQQNQAAVESNETNEAGQMLAVTIPSGVVAGQTIAVNVSGAEAPVTFQVPEGCKAGTELRLWFDPTDGTLSRMA